MHRARRRTVLYCSHSAVVSGAEISLLALLARLDRSRYFPVLSVPAVGDLEARARALGIETLRLTLRDPKPSRPRATLGSMRALAEARRRLGFDLVHANSFIAAQRSLPFALRSRVPLVASVRDIVDFPRGTGFSLGLCDRVVCVSLATRGHVRRFVPRWAHARIETVYNGVDVPWLSAPLSREQARARLGLPADAGQIFGVVAPLVRWKGQHVFLRAAATLAANLPRAAFVLAGDGRFADEEYLREIDALAASPALARRLHRPEFVDDVPALFAALDVVVCPSIAPDPLPRASLEAMGAGRAVIASRHGGLPEAVVEGESGLLVEPGSIAGLRDAMLALGTNEARVEAMGRAGRRRSFRSNFTSCACKRSTTSCSTSAAPLRDRPRRDARGRCAIPRRRSAWCARARRGARGCRGRPSSG